MPLRRGALGAAVLLLLAAACAKSGSETSSVDAAAQPMLEAGIGDAPPDGSFLDGTVETGAEAAADASLDAGADVAEDSAPDAPIDAPPTSADAPVDVAVDGDAPGTPTACIDGSPILYARTACPGSPLTPPSALVASAVSASRGDVLSLGGLAEPQAPCAPVIVCTAAAAPTMIFSDDPESPSSDGVLYADVIGPGAFRVYVYHSNGGSALRKFPVVLLNQGSQDVNAVIGPKGVAGPGTDYVAIGKSAITAWMGAATTTSLVVPAGQRVLFDSDLDGVHTSSSELAHAIIDFTLDGPVKLSVVSVGASEDAATVTAGLSLLPDDQLHQRGTFPGAMRLVQTTTPLDGAGIRRLTFGDGVSDLNLTGNDAVDQKTVSLGGNYGLVYALTLGVGVDTAFLVAPQGGAWGGGAVVAAGADGAQGIVALPAATDSLGSQSQAILLGRFAAQSSPVTATFISAGGSNLPIDVAAVPVP